MKKILLLLILALTLTKYGFAQAPQGFPYQAVARDNNGNLIANHNIALRFSILDGSNVGTTVYQETHTTTTNLLGLFNLNIGQGTIVSGTFNQINWASGAKFIKVELDTSGGNTFSLMGITQLMSVPYALHAGSTIKNIGPVIDPGHPTTDSWTQKANVGNNVRSMGVGFSIGQLGYVGTGGAGTLFSLDDFWEYNAGNNTWTQKANFPGGGRKGAVGFSIGNKGYVGTGETGNAPTSYVNYDLWEYDPAQNLWTQKTNLTGSARKFATGFSIGDKGYIGLGTNGGSDLDDFWEYDPATDTWLQKANYTGSGRQFVASFATVTKGYIGLGTDVNGNHYNDMNEYNPATNSWTGKTIIPAAGRHSTASFAMNNKGYIGTGYNSVIHLNEFWEYNPDNDTWTPKATYSGNGRKNAVGFSIGNKGYIGTGGDILERNDIWEYMDDNVSGTAYSSAANVDSNNSVTDGAWTLYNDQVYNANSGNVGIGTSTPSNKFSVVGNADISGDVGIGTTTPVNNYKLSVIGNSYFSDKVGIGTSISSNKLSVIGNADINGNLGIGTTTPTNKLSVIGNANINGSANITGNVGIGTTGTPLAPLHTKGAVMHEELSGDGIRMVFADSTGKLKAAKTLDNITNNTSQNIPQSSCTGITSNIVVSGLPTSIPSGNISVKLNISHNFNCGIRAYLEAPNGQRLNLVHIYVFDFIGGAFYNTEFSDNGSGTIASLAACCGFFGTYQPTANMSTTCGITPNVNSFSAFGGGNINPNGTWVLKVIDEISFETGVLNSWSIKFENLQNGLNNFIPKWQNNTLTKNSLIYDNGTNVGIGTVTPTSKFSVNGNADFTGKVAVGYNYLPVNQFSVLGNSDFIGNVGIGTTSPVNKLTVDGQSNFTGNVGIGTTTPHAPLHFNNTGINRKIIMYEDANNDHQYYGFGINNAILRYQVGHAGASHVFYAGTGTTSSVELMRIDGLGKVGIGTIPNASLSVIRGSGPDGTAAFFGTNNSSHFNYSAAENTYIRAGKNGAKVYINDGNIGSVVIGNVTSFPAGYKLYVDDGILTERLRVAVHGSASWADYVFADDYKLMPLEKVEEYINTNNHLPNVPSAEEMVNSGIDVATVDAKLMEKIEELTLYMIEMKKEMKKLAEENTNIKSQLKKK